MPIPAAFPLSKACHTCTKRKRKCVVELPKCQRCRQRNLECIYDLEPLVKSNAGVQQSRNETRHALINSKKTADPAAHSFLDYISSLHMSENIYACLVNDQLLHSMTAIPLAQDPEAVRYIIGEMLHIPSRVRNGRITPFIHPHLSRPKVPGHRDPDVTDVQRNNYLSYLKLDAELMSLSELVASTQNLILLLIRDAFRDSAEHTDSRSLTLDFKLLAKWRTALWESGVHGMPDDLTPWQSWILGQSVRRTILMAYLVEGTYSAWTVGYCTHQLFVNALPFNTEGRLWLASTQEEWSTLVGKPSLSTARELKSLTEFTKAFARAPFEPGDDLFQRLPLVSQHGKASVEDRLAQITS